MTDKQKSWQFKSLNKKLNAVNKQLETEPDSKVFRIFAFADQKDNSM